MVGAGQVECLGQRISMAGALDRPGQIANRRLELIVEIARRAIALGMPRAPLGHGARAQEPAESQPGAKAENQRKQGEQLEGQEVIRE